MVSNGGNVRAIGLRLRCLPIYDFLNRWPDVIFDVSQRRVHIRGGSGAGSLGGAQQLTGGGGSSRNFP